MADYKIFMRQAAGDETTDFHAEANDRTRSVPGPPLIRQSKARKPGGVSRAAHFATVCAVQINYTWKRDIHMYV